MAIPQVFMLPMGYVRDMVSSVMGGGEGNILLSPDAS